MSNYAVASIILGTGDTKVNGKITPGLQEFQDREEKESKVILVCYHQCDTKRCASVFGN